MARARSVVAVLAVLAAVVFPTGPVAASNDVSHTLVVNPNPTNGITPDVLDGEVDSMDQVGSLMVVGGTFTQVQLNGGPVLNRRYLFAFNMSTGAVSTTFVPQLDAAVETVESAGDGQNVFVGGTFTTVNGASQPLIAKLNVSTGQPTNGFAVTVNAGKRVRDMGLTGNRLFFGGQFSRVNGTTRSRLAAVNASTGALDPGVNFTFAGTHNGGGNHVRRFDISPNGQFLVAIGNFLTVNGSSRDQIVKLDIGASPATVDSWSTDAFVPQCSSSFDTYMRDVDISPDGSYFVVVTTGAFRGGPGAGVYCDSITRWESNRLGSGQQPTWRDYTGGDTSTAVLSTGAAVYVGGHFRWMNNPFAGDAQGPGAVPRSGIAALDPLNGLPLDWNPGRTRGVGVFKFLATATSLYFGSDTCCVAGETHERLAIFPLSGGTSVPAPTSITLPSNLFQLPTAGGAGGQHLTRRSFDGSTFGAPTDIATPGTDWSTARGAFYTNGFIYSGQSNGTFVRRTFDGTTVGAAQTVNLNGLSSSMFPASNITGMFLDGGFLYYTVAGDSRLFYRYFTHQSAVVGAETFVAGSGGVNWSGVQGLALASGKIYFVRTNGNLARIDFANGSPVSGTETLVNSSIDWRSRGLFFRT